MKRIFITMGVLAMFTVTSVCARAEESDRDRELLGIWKEHVKTLTKERDDAYRQLEQMKMKSAGPAAKFGGIETMPIANPMQAEQIAGLQTEVGRLQTELAKKASSDPNRELQMQYSSLQKQFQQMKKDQDRLIQEKERALAQLERGGQGGPATVRTEVRTQSDPQDAARIRELEGQLREARTEAQTMRKAASNISSSADPSDAVVRQARELQYENDTLRAQIEKLQVVEKELASTRSYFTPLVKELQEKYDRTNAELSAQRSEYAHMKSQTSDLTSQLQSIKTQTEQSRKDAENLQTEVESLRTQNQRLEADLRAIQSERDDLTAQNAGFKEQLQVAAAEREKYKGLEESLRGLREQHESLQKGYAVLEQNARTSEAELNRVTAQAAAMQTASRERDKYRTALSANLTDMKNLKSNFEAYLESLVASFEDRQR